MPKKKKEIVEKLINDHARETTLDYILNTYYLYKVCEGCDAVLLYERAICPRCKAYRFESGKKIIKKQVELAKQKKDVYFDL
jgi:uncharacterized OB-fold protein